MYVFTRGGSENKQVPVINAVCGPIDTASEMKRRDGKRKVKTSDEDPSTLLRRLNFIPLAEGDLGRVRSESRFCDW